MGFVTSNSRKVVDKHVRIGGQCGRCPVRLAVPHIPVGKAILQTLEKERAKLFLDRERRLLVPKVAKIVCPCQSGIVETHIGLLRPANPIETRRRMSNKAARTRQRCGFSNHPEQRALAPE